MELDLMDLVQLARVSEGGTGSFEPGQFDMDKFIFVQKNGFFETLIVLFGPESGPVFLGQLGWDRSMWTGLL